MVEKYPISNKEVWNEKTDTAIGWWIEKSSKYPIFSKQFFDDLIIQVWAVVFDGKYSKEKVLGIFNYGECYNFAYRMVGFLKSEEIEADVYSIITKTYNKKEEYHEYELIHSFVVSDGFCFDLSGPIDMSEIERYCQSTRPDKRKTLLVKNIDQKLDNETKWWIDHENMIANAFYPEDVNEDKKWEKVFSYIRKQIDTNPARKDIFVA